MTLTIHETLEQGSEEWLAARCGLITSSELARIMTPGTHKPANNDKTREHVYELAAQRINHYVEPTYIGDNMLRGWADEIKARERYAELKAPVVEVGGMVRQFETFKLWCSPDGLVGDDGGIECKSRIQKYQLQTIASNEVPQEYVLQVQAALLVSGRKWWDFISYSGGMPMWIIRVEPDLVVQQAIIDACVSFEAKVQEVMKQYQERLDKLGDAVIMTEREIEQEVYLG